jgi:hypothetical protein
LPPNHLRKMPAETVKFCIDFPFRLTFYVLRITHLPRRSIRAKAGSRHCHLRIAPFLHRFCTDFRKCISLLPVPQPLAKSDLKNGAIPGLSRRSPWRSRIDIACRAGLPRRSISAKAGPPKAAAASRRRPAPPPPRRQDRD